MFLGRFFIFLPHSIANFSPKNSKKKVESNIIFMNDINWFIIHFYFHLPVIQDKKV